MDRLLKRIRVTKDASRESEGSFKFYRFQFKQTADSAAGSPRDEPYIQISSIRFYDAGENRIKPKKVSNPNGASPFGEEPEKLLDDSLATKWLDFKFMERKESELRYEFAAPFSLAKYDMLTANDCPGRDPDSWILSASVDLENWTQIDSQVNIDPNPERHRVLGVFVIPMKGSITVPKPAGKAEDLAGRYYQFTFTDTVGKSYEPFIQISLISFKSGETEVFPIDCQNPKGESPSGEYPSSLLDPSLSTKWLDWHFRSHGYSTLVFEFDSDIILTSYTIFTANDCPQRDPTSWKLEVSKDKKSWKVLDARKRVSTPLDRFAELGTFTIDATRKFAGSLPAAVKVKVETKDDSSGPPVFKGAELMRKTSLELIESWTSDYKGAPTEYDKAKDMIVVEPKFMKQSKMQCALLSIDKEFTSKPSESEFTKALEGAIAIAYSCKPAETIRVSCMLAGYSLHRDITVFYRAMGWKQKYVTYALKTLTQKCLEKKDGSSLIGLLSLLARGGNECEARKLMAFSTLISALSLDSLEDFPGFESIAVVKRLKGLEKVLDVEALKPALKRIHKWFEEFIEDYKMKAYRSAFQEPTRLLFDRAYDHVMRDDAEVHGSNTYAVALMSCLGVRLPFVPFVRDEVKGCIAFLQSKAMRKFFEELWKPENFGKDWETVTACRAAPSTSLPAPNRQFIYSAGTPVEIGNALISKLSTPKQRAAAAEYMELYASFFSGKFFLEKACLSLTRAEEGPAADIEVVFKCIRKHWAELGIDEPAPESDSINEWIYSEDYEFLTPRAWKLLHLIGLAIPFKA